MCQKKMLPIVMYQHIASLRKLVYKHKLIHKNHMNLITNQLMRHQFKPPSPKVTKQFLEIPRHQQYETKDCS